MSTAETIVIEPRRGLVRISARELWHYRDLFTILTWRDVKVRYQQTVFGALWAVLQPVLLMLVFAVFLGRLADVPSAGVPYPLFAYCALVPWTFFSQGLAGSAQSLVENERLVTKVYFPRLLVPTAAAASYVVDFLIGHVLLVGMLVHYGVGLRATMLLVPLLALGVFAAIASYGLGLAALNVRYRDVRYAIPFALQLLLFLTPVVYPATLVTGGWRYAYAVNPMAGLIDLYRWAILGTERLPGSVLAVSAFAAVALLLLGIVYFQRVERSFADVI
ncbi:MAG: ABC transporter permease [Chloroflexota bacterium]